MALDALRNNILDHFHIYHGPIKEETSKDLIKKHEKGKIILYDEEIYELYEKIQPDQFKIIAETIGLSDANALMGWPYINETTDEAKYLMYPDPENDDRDICLAYVPKRQSLFLTYIYK